MKPDRYYEHRLRSTIGVITILAGMVAVATAVAYFIELGGEPRWRAALGGAVVGFFVIWWPLFIFGQIQMAIWRRTRGFPIADGQRIEITCGPLEGEQGTIQFRGQGPTTYVVALDGKDDVDDWLTLSHTEVRRVHASEEAVDDSARLQDD